MMSNCVDAAPRSAGSRPNGMAPKRPVLGDRLKWRWRTLIVLAGMLASALLGCGGRTPPDGDEKPPPAPPPKVESIRWQGEQTGYRAATRTDPESDVAHEPKQ